MLQLHYQLRLPLQLRPHINNLIHRILLYLLRPPDHLIQILQTNLIHKEERNLRARAHHRLVIHLSHRIDKHLGDVRRFAKRSLSDYL